MMKWLTANKVPESRNYYISLAANPGDLLGGDFLSRVISKVAVVFSIYHPNEGTYNPTY